MNQYSAATIAGKRFGKLVVSHQVGSKKSSTLWFCRCDCGAEVVTNRNTLVSGKTTSCGCGRIVQCDTETKKTPTYKSWKAMMTRCLLKTAVAYHQYGAIGIDVCERWKVFSNFLHDMGERPPRTTIDRIDGSKGYYLENCRWATHDVQARNRKCVKFIEYNGIRQCISDWADSLGWSRNGLRHRLKIMSVAHALQPKFVLNALNEE